MKTNTKNNKTAITDKKAFWIGVLTILFVMYCATIVHAEDRFRGSVEQAYFPINDEHGIYAETSIKTELDVYKNFFIFAGADIEWAKDIKKPDRTEKRITSYDLFDAGYMSKIDAGVGYKINKNWYIKLLYRADRTPNANVGDFTGVVLGCKWGQ